jgi:hypothetical protein
VISRFRQSVAVPLAALVAFLGASALATQRWWLLPLLLVPLAVFWWGLRSGVDADAESLRVRGLLGSRAVPWSEIAGFRLVRRRVRASLTNGNELPLPGVSAAELPALIAASGSTLESPAGSFDDQEQ